MNSYFHNHALVNDSRNISSCFLFFNDVQKLVGYFCWNAAATVTSGLAPKDARGLPGYPMPAVLISRLAVDKAFHGQGFGSEILKTAFTWVVELSGNAIVPAFRYVIVDAIDANAIVFYKKYGFKPFLDQPSKLYLPTATIKKAIIQGAEQNTK